MSDFKAKMHQIVCRLGLRFRPRWGELITNAPQAPSWILGGLLLREGRGGEGTPCFPVTPPATTVYIKAWFNRYCYVEGFCTHAQWEVNRAPWWWVCRLWWLRWSARCQFRPLAPTVTTPSSQLSATRAEDSPGSSSSYSALSGQCFLCPYETVGYNNKWAKKN